VINFLVKSGNVGDATKYYSELIDAGLVPNLETFQSVLHGITQGTNRLFLTFFSNFHTGSKLESGKQYLEEMKKYSVEPDFLCLAYMASTYAAAADFSKLKVTFVNIDF
jgi:pentatricopeptide repeat protein